jgi:hypothetical protein
MSPKKVPKSTARWLCVGLLLLVACEPLPTAPNRVTLVADGDQRTIQTELGSVRELLTDQGVSLGDLDHVTPPETAALRDGLTVTVVRVLQQTETFTETVPFGRQIVRDATVAEGEARLLQSGEAGVLTRVYRITLEDDVEIERTLMQEAVTQSPQDEIRLVGTRPKLETVNITGTLAYLNNQDAWVLRNSNRGRRRITTLGDLDGRVFTLSPDATLLLFTRGVTEPEHINELWMVRTAEADPNPIPLNVSDLLWAGWHPDGELIAWTTAERTEQAPGWRGQNDLWTASLGARNTLVSRRKVLDVEAGGGYGWWGTRYVWSPTGEMLAYARPESVGVVDLRQAERQPLLTFPAYRTYSSWAWHPAVAWSPDGSFIAAAIHGPAPTGGDPEESPVFNVWAIEATGAYSASLASEVGMWSMPQYAPGGETPHDGASNGEILLVGRAVVPYQSDISPYTLCLIDRDGSDQRCFDPPGETGIELPSWRWSPDGETVAFIQLGGIYLLSVEDGVVIPLVDDGGISQLDWR